MTSQSDEPLLSLRSGPLRLLLAPTVGGSIAALYSDVPNTGRVDWLRPASAAGLAARDPLAMASFPLVPWCNRIRDGRAQFGGRDIRIQQQYGNGHPLHGVGWHRPWQVLAHCESSATLGLTVAADAQWPWRFSATQHYALSDDGLTCTLNIVNEDTAPMPVGIGHHPYFPHLPGTRLRSRTDQIWLGDAELMPTGLARNQAVELLTQGVELAALNLDNNFTGWQRETLIEWPQGAGGPARSLTLTAESPLDYFVLYCPSGADHFCAEPVSQCTDWLNLIERYPQAAIGGAEVVPGDNLQAAFAFRVACD